MLNSNSVGRGARARAALTPRYDRRSTSGWAELLARTFGTQEPCRRARACNFLSFSAYLPRAHLWPLYVSREASTDTLTLVEAFLAQDRELAERLREPESAGLRPPSLALPADHERATLLRTQRRRARQSMVVNSLALLVSLAMTAFYVWDLVPRWAYTSAALGLRLPWAMSAAVEASAWALRLGIPLGLLLIPLAFFFRKHVKVPRFLQSGTVLAIATGVTLVLAQLCWLALLNEASVAMEGAYQALQATRR